MSSPSLPWRDFLKQTAATVAIKSGLNSMTDPQSFKTIREFAAYQQKRRRLLWSLLGDLPFNHRPKSPKLSGSAIPTAEPAKAPLYQKFGKAEDCRIDLFDCAHEELPEMRRLVLEWLDRYLVNG